MNMCARPLARRRLGPTLEPAHATIDTAPAFLFAVSAAFSTAEPTVLKSPTGKVEVSFSLRGGRRRALTP